MKDGYGKIRKYRGVVRRGMDAFFCKSGFIARADFLIFIFGGGYEGCDDF